jgi:hypothetical protein
LAVLTFRRGGAGLPAAECAKLYSTAERHTRAAGKLSGRREGRDQ